MKQIKKQTTLIEEPKNQGQQQEQPQEPDFEFFNDDDEYDFEDDDNEYNYE